MPTKQHDTTDLMNNSAGNLAELGASVRKARRDRQVTLEELAKLSGVSKSVLSQLERGTTNPTVSTLWSVAGALGLDPSNLFGAGATTTASGGRLANPITKVEDPLIQNADKGYRLIILSQPELVSMSELYRLELDPGGALVSEPHKRGTMEQVTVLKGEVEIQCGSSTLVLKKGETARYAGDMSHSISAPSRKSAEVILFLTFDI